MKTLPVMMSLTLQALRQELNGLSEAVPIIAATLSAGRHFVDLRPLVPPLSVSVSQNPQNDLPCLQVLSGNYGDVGNLIFRIKEDSASPEKQKET